MTTSPPRPALSMARRGSPLASAAAQLARLARVPLSGAEGAGAEDAFEARLLAARLPELRAAGVEVLQLNVGKLCNQTCSHCHVDAGPDRREVMTRVTAEQCMRLLADSGIPTVDITGGAPEMCPSFRYLVEESRRLGRHVLDRCNLTILSAPGYADLPEFLARHEVEVVCSLPHYRKLSTDRQRGEGVFERSLAGLRALNAVGYGQAGTGLRLVLVTNPVGAFLPGDQPALELEWKRELARRHDIRFDALFTITNMPISRYLEWLESSGNLDGYLHKLVAAFNPAAVAGLMCRSTLSVDWRGRFYDCDFNQMLELGVDAEAPQHVGEFDRERLAGRRIVTGPHCFGCTAGAGSSCGGSLDA